MKYKSWKNAIVSETDTVKDIIKNLLSTGFQICLIVKKKKKLIGTITDGDLRSFVLDKKSFNTKIKFLMNKKPFYADEELPNQKIFQIMKLNKMHLFAIVILGLLIGSMGLLSSLGIHEQYQNINIFIFLIQN